MPGVANGISRNHFLFVCLFFCLSVANTVRSLLLCNITVHRVQQCCQQCSALFSIVQHCAALLSIAQHFLQIFVENSNDPDRGSLRIFRKFSLPGIVGVNSMFSLVTDHSEMFFWKWMIVIHCKYFCCNRYNFLLYLFPRYTPDVLITEISSIGQNVVQ